MKFHAIVADPPWLFDDKYGHRGCDKKYDVLTIAELLKLRVRKIAADDAILVLWVPAALLKQGLEVMEAWGFVQQQVYTWVKLTRDGGLRMGMGRTWRNCTEIALVGKRGRPVIRDKSRRNVGLDRYRGHSVKLEKMQDDLERMVRGPRLELFARRKRKGWTCVGLELNEEDVRKSIRRLRKLPEHD